MSPRSAPSRSVQRRQALSRIGKGVDHAKPIWPRGLTGDFCPTWQKALC